MNNPFGIPGIKPAFESNKILHYEYEQIFNEPALRCLSALDIYNDMERKIDNKQMIEVFEGIQKLLTHRNQRGNIEVDVYKINELCSLSLEKLKWVINIDLVWRLASVLYFDASEDPKVHDLEYGDKKIERWKKDEGIEEMLKKKSLKSFFPWLSTLEIDLKNYSRVQAKLTSYLSQKVSSASRTP